MIGTFVKLPRPEVVGVLASAGFDFLICDMEHAQITEIEARTVVHACSAAAVPVVVRLPEPSAGTVNRLLEAGASGIQAPRIRHRQDVAALRSMTCFPPKGSRSVGTAHPAADYGRVPVADYVVRANAEVLVVGQLETADTEEPLDELVRALDIVFIGPVDLAVTMGFPGDGGASTVRRRVNEIEAAARAASVPLGIFAPTVNEATELIARGYRYIALAGDISFLAASATAAIEGLKSTIGDRLKTSGGA